MKVLLLEAGREMRVEQDSGLAHQYQVPAFMRSPPKILAWRGIFLSTISAMMPIGACLKRNRRKACYIRALHFETLSALRTFLEEAQQHSCI
jgi:hypothetical protein